MKGSYNECCVWNNNRINLFNIRNQVHQNYIEKRAFEYGCTLWQYFTYSSPFFTFYYVFDV